MSWVIPTNTASDHAAGNDGSGPSWVASVVNAIGTSQYWKDTAIIITWDDWGGWYDHVPPTLNSQFVRVWLAGAADCRIALCQGGLHLARHPRFWQYSEIYRDTCTACGTVDPAVGYADSRSDDLSDCFDLNQTPLTFTPIKAPLDAQFFLNDKRPPEGPDDD